MRIWKPWEGGGARGEEGGEEEKRGVSSGLR